MFNFFVKQKKIKLEYLEVSITDHCNLGCQACTHFSNIAEPHFYDIEQYEKDIKETAGKFEIKEFRILGGEPLLHPEINTIIDITKKYLPDSILQVVSNGILIPTMDESFFKCLNKNCITVNISYYPYNDKLYQNIYDTLSNNNVNYYVLKNHYFFQIFNPESNNNREEMFKNCYVKKCTNLRNGRIYHCPIGIYIETYNKKYGTNLTFESGISIQESAKKIVKYLSKPIESCKYCNFYKNKPYKYIKWKISKKEKDEWYRL